MKNDHNHQKVKCRAQWESNTVVRHSAGVWIPHWNTILLKAEKMVCTLRNISIERKTLYLVERKQGTLHFRLFLKIFFLFYQKLEYRFEVFTCDSVNIQITHFMEVYISQEEILFFMFFSLCINSYCDVLVVIRVSKSETLVRDKQFSGYGP